MDGTFVMQLAVSFVQKCDINGAMIFKIGISQPHIIVTKEVHEAVFQSGYFYWRDDTVINNKLFRGDSEGEEVIE